MESDLEKEKCYYCEKNNPSEEHPYTHTMYEIIKSAPIPGMGFSYRKHKVIIPRCKICAKEHSSGYFKIFTPILLITILLIGYYQYTSNYELIFKIIYLVAFTLFFNLIYEWIYDNLIHNKLYKSKAESNIEDYDIIKEKLNLGWRLSKPAKGELIQNEDLSDTSPFKKK
jgi:hypothetical protein